MISKLTVPTLLKWASGCTALLWALTFSASAAAITSKDLIDNRYLVIQAADQADQIVPDPKGSVVKDIVTGLEWQRCSVGQTWNSATRACDGSASTHDWESARVLTAAGGFTTPTIDELSSLVYCSSRDGDKYGQSKYGQCDGSYTKPAINSIAFPDTLLPRTYWSSDPYEGHSLHAWRTYFENGFVDWNSRSDGLYVRLV